MRVRCDIIGCLRTPKWHGANCRGARVFLATDLPSRAFCHRRSLAGFRGEWLTEPRSVNLRNGSINLLATQWDKQCGRQHQQQSWNTGWERILTTWSHCSALSRRSKHKQASGLLPGCFLPSFPLPNQCKLQLIGASRHLPLEQIGIWDFSAHSCITSSEPPAIVFCGFLKPTSCCDGRGLAPGCAQLLDSCSKQNKEKKCFRSG